MSSCDHVPRMRRALPLLIVAAVRRPPPRPSAQGTRPRRRAARPRRSRRRSDLADGRGVRNGRELIAGTRSSSPCSARSSAPDEREQADELLARPTDQGDVGQPGGPYSPCRDGEERLLGRALLRALGRDHRPTRSTTADTTPANGRPDYVDDMIASFQQSYAGRERRARLEPPVSDGSPRRQRQDRRLHQGHRRRRASTATRAPTRPAAAAAATRSWCWTTTMTPSQFPGYTRPAGADAGHRGARVQPRAPVRLRHVPGHVDVRVDRDLGGGEGLRPPSTTTSSTWARGRTSPTPADHLTATARATTKMYGSAIWNHWLDRPLRLADRPPGVGVSQAQHRRLAAGSRRVAYDTAIQDSCGGPGFAIRAVATLRGRHGGVGRARQRRPRGPEVPAGGLAARHADARRRRRRPAPSTTPRSRSTTCPLPSAVTSSQPLPDRRPARGHAPGSIALVGHRSDGSMTSALGAARRRRPRHGLARRTRAASPASPRSSSTPTPRHGPSGQRLELAGRRQGLHAPATTTDRPRALPIRCRASRPARNRPGRPTRIRRRRRARRRPLPRPRRPSPPPPPRRRAPRSG